MIKLKSLLREVSSHDFKSWLNPAGEFTATTPENDKGIRNHLSSALDIIPAEVDLTDEEPMDYLWRRGWQRIAKGRRYELWCENPHMMPNQKQRKALQELARLLDVDYVHYDNGKSHRPDHIIWSRGDKI